MKSISQILEFFENFEKRFCHPELVSGSHNNSQIKSLYLDSRKCDKQSGFIALKGLSSDGNDYIEEVMANGVKLILSDRLFLKSLSGCHPELVSGSHKNGNSLYKVDSGSELGMTLFVCIKDLKDKLAGLAHWFYDYKKPANVIGITGTNGKTSISNYIAQFLTLNNSATLLLGTNGNGIYPNLLESTHTTLDVLSLYETISCMNSETLNQVQNDGLCIGGEFRNLVMEVSSHSLDQGRTKGLDFDVAVFSNLTQDHLDYHKTMENYFLAKVKLFQNDTLRYSIINIDDEYGKRLVNLAKGKVLTVSLKSKNADIYLQVLSADNMITSFSLYDSCQKVGEYKTTLLGEFNLMNLALSITVLKANNNFENILENIANIQPVKGRMEVISLKKNVQVIIDYAHTPDALENVLKTLQQYKPHKLWCIFGCGGNRDTSKRAIMASIAEKYADKVVVTEDNNRFEAVHNIFADIKTGFDNLANHTFIDSREKAVKYAIENAESGDIILLAGKGHECYLDKNGVKEYFDEREIVDEYNY